MAVWLQELTGCQQYLRCMRESGELHRTLAGISRFVWDNTDASYVKIHKSRTKNKIKVFLGVVAGCSCEEIFRSWRLCVLRIAPSRLFCATNNALLRRNLTGDRPTPTGPYFLGYIAIYSQQSEQNCSIYVYGTNQMRPSPTNFR